MGFFIWERGRSWDGLKEIRSECCPGSDMVGRAGPRTKGRAAGMPTPETGVEAREVSLLGARDPLTPFEVVTDAGFLPQVGTGAAARGLTGPRAGKSSSDAVLKGTEGFLAGAGSSAFCFPEAFSLRAGVGAASDLGGG
jgi:hypothetical protein